MFCGTTAAGMGSGGANATREVAPVPLRTHARSSNVSNIVGDVVGGGAYRMKGANNWINIQLGISEMSLDDIVINMIITM